MPECMCRLLHRKRRAPERALLTGTGSILLQVSLGLHKFLLEDQQAEKGPSLECRFIWISSIRGTQYSQQYDGPASPCRMCNRRCPGHVWPAIFGCSFWSARCETCPRLGPGKYHCRCVSADAETSLPRFLLVCRIHSSLHKES